MICKRINHINVVVTSVAEARAFLVDVLEFEPHPVVPVWLVSGDTTVHLVEIEGAQSDRSVYRQLQHTAFEVDNLDEVFERLTTAPAHLKLAPFRMGVDMKEQSIKIPQDIDLGIGTIFVRDADGNLFEFVQRGRGIYSDEGLAALIRAVQEERSA